jgi:putative acetyltransferase
MVVRDETGADEAAVDSVNRAAFGRAAEAEVVAAIRSSGLLFASLVAEVDGEVVGHLLLSFVQLDDMGVLCLAPVAVAPEHQGRGLGSALVRESIARAEAAGEPLVVLLGHPWYYPRFGFEPARPLGIEPPFDVPDEAWMVRRLSRYAGQRGRVAYPPAFDAVS